MYIAGFAEATLDCFDAVPVCAHPFKSIGRKANAARKIRCAVLSVLKFVVCMFFLSPMGGFQIEVQVEDYGRIWLVVRIWSEPKSNRR